VEMRSAYRATDGATSIVDTAWHTARAAHELLEIYLPLAKRMAPVVARYAERISTIEIEAGIRLLDDLPRLVRQVASDVLPTLSAVDELRADVHRLLVIVDELRTVILSGSGLSPSRDNGDEKYPHRPADNDGQPD